MCKGGRSDGGVGVCCNNTCVRIMHVFYSLLIRVCTYSYVCAQSEALFLSFYGGIPSANSGTFAHYLV